MKLPVVFTAVLLLLPGIASATDLSVFGIKFGEPLGFRECAKRYGSYTYGDSKACFKKADLSSPGIADFYISFPFGEIPLYVAGMPGVSVIDGKVEQISFSTWGLKSKEEVLVALQKKYGKPSQIIPDNKENMYGKILESSIFIWKFPEIEVTYFDMQNKIDDGLVNILTPKASALRIKNDQDSKNEAKKKERPL